MLLWVQTKPVVPIPAHKVEVADVSGAGDTVIATLAYGILEDMAFLDAAKLANKAASIVVQHVGTYPISHEDLFPKKKKVFVNGCFDILHSGHIFLLREAKKMGDVLVIGLNSDSSVKAIKGPSRPVNSYNDRKKILQALNDVDLVIEMDDITPTKLIEKEKPDIIIKGEDYKGKDLPEQIIIDKLKIDVQYVQLFKEQSTTKIIEKIKQ